MPIIGWIGIGVAVVASIVGFFIAKYNSLVKKKNECEEAFATMDVYLKQRWDSVPNFVEIVKGYASQEKTVLENVTAARSGYMNAKSTDEKMAADNELTSTLKTLFAVVENYPELKSNENFAKLQDELSETEDKISFARQFYNDTVTMYNNNLLIFPNNIIGNIAGFKPESLYKIESEDAKKAPKIQF